MESAGRKLGVRVATVKLRALRRKHARVRSSERRAMYGRLRKAARYVSLWPVPIFMPGS